MILGDQPELFDELDENLSLAFFSGLSFELALLYPSEYCPWCYKNLMMCEEKGCDLKFDIRRLKSCVLLPYGFQALYRFFVQ